MTGSITTLSEGSKAFPRVMLTTPDGGQTIVSLDKPTITLGRSSESDIRINFNFISATQARLEREGDTYRFVQVGKTNPTFYKDKPIESRLLLDGDSLRIGALEGPNVILSFQFKEAQSFSTLAETTAGMAPPTDVEAGRFLGSASLQDRAQLSIGRDAKCDLVLSSMNVSRRHATVEQRADRHSLVDLQSTNGTYVNGYRVKERILDEGDVIRIGHFRLVYQDGEVRGYDEERSVRLDARRISKKAGDALLLDDISLSVLPGELLAIVGTSGSGKSTLMDALNGVRPASAGFVLVNNADLYRHFGAICPLLGYVPQFPTLHESLPLERALYYSGRLRFPSDVEDEVVWQRVREVMDSLELSDRAKVLVGRLSGGQQKRASIAAELMTEPGLFFLDEPATGLDPGLTRRLMEIIRKLADEGRTVILVTHDTESLSFCDLMVFLKAGRVAYIGRPKDAPRHFSAENLGEVYTKVSAEKSTRDFAKEFQASPEFTEYVTKRQKDVPEPEPSLPFEKAQDPILVKRRGASFFQQLSVLLLRYTELLRRDARTLLLLLLQAPLIALLLDLVFEKSAMITVPGFTKEILRTLPKQLAGFVIPPLPLFMAASVTWLGSINASREIVKELPMFRRERLAGLRVFPYLLSKVGVLGVLCFLQSALFFFTVAAHVEMGEALAVGVTAGVFESPGAEIFFTLFLTCVASMGLGLLISASSTNPDRALSLVPMILIPQLIFAGTTPGSHPIIDALSYLSISRWAFEAMGSTMGLPGGFLHTPEYLLTRWAALGGFTLVLFGVTLFLLARRRLA